jgi:succinate dehydrogenase / fumarate reductase, flavoprotein subunit
VKPGTEFVLPLLRRLRDTMWTRCGVVRDRDGLQAALDDIADIRAGTDDVDVRQTSHGWEDLARLCTLRAALRCAEITVRGALARTESRGAHNRSDFPEVDDDLLANLVFALDGDALVETVEPVPPIRAGLAQLVEQHEEPEVAGRLLE